MPVPTARQARRSVGPIQTVDQSPLAPNRGNRGLIQTRPEALLIEIVINVARAFHHSWEEREFLEMGFF